MSYFKYSKDENTEQDVKSWDLPFVESDEQPDESETNALNRRSDWRYEPPEPEEEILPPTAEEIEAIRAAARDEGYEEGKQEGFEKGKTEGFEKGESEGFDAGFEKGKTQALEETEQEISQKIAQWESLMSSLHDPIVKSDQSVQEALVLLAVTLAKSVIQVETTTNPDVIKEALQQAINALPANDQMITIKLHPNDLALIKEAFSEEHMQAQKWHLVASDAIGQGGCDVSTTDNAVDYSIERRCKDVINTFLLQQGLSDV